MASSTARSTSPRSLMYAFLSKIARVYSAFFSHMSLHTASTRGAQRPREHRPPQRMQAEAHSRRREGAVEEAEGGGADLPTHQLSCSLSIIRYSVFTTFTCSFMVEDEDASTPLL